MSKTKDKLSRLAKRSLQKLSEHGEDGLHKAAIKLDKLQDRRFCLGITGLSQSGKSTFISSLVNQLLNHQRASLPGFSPVLSERLLGVKLLPLEDRGLQSFPYQESLQQLCEPNPSWPPSTVDASGCKLELILKKPAGLLSGFGRDHYSLFLELRDYPGEWLLDLPLREMSYSRWCSQCSAQYTRSPRRELLAQLLEDLQEIDPLAEACEQALQTLRQRFVEFLRRCKDGEHSLSLIQPGRFLIPGTLPDNIDADALCFIPLLKVGSYSEGQLAEASESSYYKVCQRRYQKYIEQLVEPFYKQFFSGIDRQLVLVDVVSALNAGPAYMDDMRQALSNITDSFAYGRRNRLRQLFTPRIDKVVFAASKIDQILSEDHEAVRELLSVLVRQAYSNAQHEGVAPVCEAAAAVRSSREIDHRGERGLSGHARDGGAIGYIHPRIPNRIPEGEQWQPFEDWQIPLFNPPRGLSLQNGDAIPHIRLDTVLNNLIGDKCL